MIQSIRALIWNYSDIWLIRFFNANKEINYLFKLLKGEYLMIFHVINWMSLDSGQNRTSEDVTLKCWWRFLLFSDTFLAKQSSVIKIIIIISYTPETLKHYNMTSDKKQYIKLTMWFIKLWSKINTTMTSSIKIIIIKIYFSSRILQWHNQNINDRNWLIIDQKCLLDLLRRKEVRGGDSEPARLSRPRRRRNDGAMMEEQLKEWRK